MPNPLKLYWWNDRPNFGDEISRVVTAHASGREVEWAKPKECDLFALGSIIQIARRTHRKPREDGTKPWLWGSGCMGPLRKDFKDNVTIALVRGPITASLMNVDMTVFGDPGLLIAEAMSEEIQGEDRIGLVPHHSQLDDPALASLVKKEKALRLIDVRGDALQVCRDIAACRHVISSSLHGLITADSFGVPNTWLNPAGIHQSPTLKFYDYAASVERALPAPLPVDQVAKYINKLPSGDISYGDGILRSKRALLDHFPGDLKVATSGKNTRKRMENA
ncbi:MAG: polysaccharide pyruvyl transferase family protein [Rhodobacteraceae bacterium]|nr:polysaccharide pyruvyl transferase family protein [Paracoccaceae bacterium]